jgi:3-methyladenine DNA glycosylase AlkC
MQTIIDRFSLSAMEMESDILPVPVERLCHQSDISSDALIVTGENKSVPVSQGSLHCIGNESIEKLSSGVLKNSLNQQQKMKKLLNDVTESQRVILETLQQENAKFSECQILHEVNDVMDKAKVYHTKLLNIKKEMLSLHEKSAELKRRAVRIQQEKQKEALHREHKREQELEKERKLTARMAKPT